MKRSQALDVVRGVAILLVMIWHYIPRTTASPQFILQLTRITWSGVDLFFVLSGFLIGGILLQNVEAGSYFKTFYIRRSARILPLYILAVMAFALLVHYHPDVFVKSLKISFPLWVYPIFVQNFMSASLGTFGTQWMSVTWSLAVEEQFYVFLSIAVRKLNEKILAYVAVFLMLLAPILRYFAPNPIAAYVLPIHRADSLMLGVLFALIWKRDEGREFFRRHAVLFRWSFLVLLACVAVLSYRGMKYGDTLGHTWLALCYGNFLILGLISDANSRWSIFKSRVLEWFGLRSYGIYLMHLPFLLFSRFALPRIFDLRLSIWSVALIAAVLTLIASEISYRFFEKPFMAFGQRYKYE